MIKKLLIILVVFFALFFSYGFFSNKIAFTSDDEAGWIADSYFTQFYLKGDFRSIVWDNETSSDQPMMTRLVFGLWLYPRYLYQKRTEPTIDYIDFLIEHGFYDMNGLLKYEKFRDSVPGYTTLWGNGAGYSDELVARLGKNILKSIELIKSIRFLNSILLALSVTIMFLLFKNRKGLLFSLIFTFFYAFNSFILNWGLLAQSEALFLLLFNSSLFFLCKYIFHKNSIKNLLFFSIFSGLCFSTKLNGIMLYFVYIVQVIIFPDLNRAKSILFDALRIITPLLISLIIFIILNPYTYPSPIQNIYTMFTHRENTAQLQSIMFPNVSLPNLPSRLQFITKTFETNYLFLGDKIVGGIFDPLLTSILFVTGFIFEVGKIIKKDKFSIFMFSLFTTIFVITVSYLQLAWPRYLIQLVLFFIYYQILGLLFYLKLITRPLVKSINRFHQKANWVNNVVDKISVFII